MDRSILEVAWFLDLSGNSKRTTQRSPRERFESPLLRSEKRKLLSYVGFPLFGILLTSLLALWGKRHWTRSADLVDIYIYVFLFKITRYWRLGDRVTKRTLTEAMQTPGRRRKIGVLQRRHAAVHRSCEKLGQYWVSLGEETFWKAFQNHLGTGFWPISESAMIFDQSLQPRKPSNMCRQLPHVIGLLQWGLVFCEYFLAIAAHSALIFFSETAVGAALAGWPWLIRFPVKLSIHPSSQWIHGFARQPKRVSSWHWTRRAALGNFMNWTDTEPFDRPCTRLLKLAKNTF